MKYKDYIKKHDKIISPIQFISPQISLLSILSLIADEIDGELSEELKDLVEKHKNKLWEYDLE